MNIYGREYLDHIERTHVNCLFTVPKLTCPAMKAGLNETTCNRTYDLSWLVDIVSKGLPRQTELAQGVPGRLRLRIFLTFRHYKGGRSSAKSAGRLYLKRNPWHSLSKAESTPGHMVLSGAPRKKSPVTSPGIDPGTSRLVEQCLKHYATPVLVDIVLSKIYMLQTWTNFVGVMKFRSLTK